MKISQPSVTVVLGLVLSRSAFAQVTQSPPPSVDIASAGNSCTNGYVKITTLPGCTAAMKEVGLSNFQGTETANSWPGGCYQCDDVANCTDGAWFNKHADGAANGDARPICALPGWEDGVRVTLFVGDSDIDYWKTDGEYPGSANVGVAGDTCKDLNRILDDRLQTYKPARVVIVCGENDLMGGQDADATFANFQTAIGKIHASGARAVYLGTKPEPDTKWLHGKYERYDAKIRDYVRDLQANSEADSPPLVMVDVYPAFVAMGNPKSLYSWDELHLSGMGYAHWNTWTKTVLADESGCSHWMNNACVKEPALPSVIRAPAGNSCPDPYVKLTTRPGCEAAMQEVGLSKFQGTERERTWPSGCYHCAGVPNCSNGVWFNKHRVGTAVPGATPICALSGWENGPGVATLFVGDADIPADVSAPGRSLRGDA